MLIRHSKTSNRFVLPTSLSTSLTVNWSVWRLSMLFLLNTTPSSHPYSFLIRWTSINSSLHSKTKRVNALLEMWLHRHPLPSTNSSSTACTACFFCGGLHFERDCNEKCKASEAAKKQLQERKSRFKRKEQAKHVEDTDTITSESAQGKTAQSEFAGHASALSSSTRSQWLKSRACADWNTDTGASSHMTPHKHWFRSYSPHVVAVKLADHSTIYSAGIGSVEFQPVIDGIPERPVVFHDVLHVPDLASNLLSLLHLAH